MWIIILIGYIIGCVLSYGRVYGANKSIDYTYIKSCPPSKLIEDFDDFVTIAPIVLLSWIGLFIGTEDYEKSRDRYFISFSNKDLWELHEKMVEKSNSDLTN